ncbi:MAG: MFS transporter [Promethearchaeota archaeon]
MNDIKSVRSKSYLVYLVIVLMFVEILDTYTTNFPNVIPSKIIKTFLSGYPEKAASAIFSFSVAIASFGMYLVFFNQLAADRIGRKILLILTVLGMGLTSLLIMFSSDIIQYTIYLFLLYMFFSSDMWVIYINEESPKDKRALLTNLVLVGGVTGSILLPVFRSIFITETSSNWRGMPLFAIILGIPLSIVIFFTLKETSKFEEIKQSLRISDDKNREGLFKKNLQTIFTSPHRNEVLAILIISFFVGFNYIFVSIGESYISSSPNLNEDDINIIILVMSLAVILGYLFTGYFADKVGRKPLFYIYSIMIPISIMIVIFGSSMVQGAIILVCLGAALVNVSYWGLGVVIRIVILEIVPTEVRGTAGGLKSFISAVGITLGLVLSGIITLIASLEIAFIILSLILVINLPLIYKFIKETKGINLSDVK